MYVKRDTVYADPYKMLKGRNIVGYQLKGKSSDFVEIDAPTDVYSVIDGIATWAGGLGTLVLGSNPTYENLKKRLIKIRYNNDDQIAIILNNDPVEMQRMQAWREWATDLAKKFARK